MSGASQVAVRLVDEPETASSLGLSGLADCSSASVTVTVIVWSAVITRVPVPLVAWTVTSWTLSVPKSCGSSKFGADLNVSSPVVPSISNRALVRAAGDRVAGDVVIVSSSDASTVPAVVWFSAASNVAEDVNDGAVLSSLSLTVTVAAFIVPTS